MKLWDRFFGPRFSVRIVGRESGQVHHVSFVRFRHEYEAVGWCARMNERHPDGLTYFEVDPL